MAGKIFLNGRNDAFFRFFIDLGDKIVFGFHADLGIVQLAVRSHLDLALQKSGFQRDVDQVFFIFFHERMSRLFISRRSSLWLFLKVKVLNPSSLAAEVRSSRSSM